MKSCLGNFYNSMLLLLAFSAMILFSKHWGPPTAFVGDDLATRILEQQANDTANLQDPASSLRKAVEVWKNEASDKSDQWRFSEVAHQGKQ